MSQTVTFDLRVTVQDDHMPYVPAMTKRFGKLARVEVDVPEAAHRLRERLENFDIPQGREAFIHALFESWGKSATRVILKWLSEVHEQGGFHAPVRDFPTEWEGDEPPRQGWEV